MPKKSHDLDDFIAEKIEIRNDLTINPEDKLFNFTGIKISAIDAEIHPKISQHLHKIKTKLRQLKSLLND